MAKSTKRSRAGKKAATTRKIRKTTTAAKRTAKRVVKKATGRKTTGRKTSGRTARRRAPAKAELPLPTSPAEIAGRARRAFAKLASRVRRIAR